MAVTRSSMSVLTVSVVSTLLTLVHTTLPSAAMDFRGMEDNCILSFVVPRDKVKSSCDMEERVTRRLNAMETKVTLYKQHVQELQEQLTKERQFHRHRLDELNERLAQSEAHSPPERLLEKRIQGLEEELRKIRTTVASSSKPTQPPGLGEKPLGRGMGLGMVPLGRSREEEEKAITILVKTVVHSEVKKLFDNYTHYVGRYVRDQAMAYNQIMKMVPRPDHSFHTNNLPPKWSSSKPSGNDVEQESTPQPADSDMVLLNELEGIRSRLNTTGKRLAEHVHSVLNSVNVSTAAPPTQSPQDSGVADTTASPLPGPAAAGQNDHDSSPLDINDTSSGDANDTATDHNITLTFTHLANDTDHGADNNQHVLSGADSDSEPSSSGGNKDTASAKSRMSYNADVNKLPEPREEGAGGGGDGGRPGVVPGNLSGWRDSMVHDQSAGEWIQELLRTEVQSLLQQQVDEVVNLVRKHTSMVDSKLHDQEVKFGQLEQRLAADIKHLSQVVSGLKLEMSSVSQGLQTLYSRADRAEQLEDTVMEMKKNMSQEGGSRLLATLIDEQGKKVRKMERLTDIYKQSLEHYRNETKLEYRDVKERLGKEVTLLRALHADLFHNVTQHADQLALQLNASANRQVDKMEQRVQVMEDNSLLQQIDLSSFERQLKSKTSKAERDLNRLSEDVGELKHKTRNLQKNFNNVMTGQNQLSKTMEQTTTKMQHLQIEVKLNVLDDWVPYDFDYMKTRTDCFGDQYIRKSGFKTGRLVGVVLCTKNRYKIFLGQSLVDTFKNIGDDSGMGEDHCQFVNARSMSRVKVSPFRTSTETEPGYVRTHWGQEPRPELLNIIRPSPAWYECGVSIP
ncbi:uncharacterized protein LOC143286784 [Babylonia areolata]|uniref:uncharacterized protein LOC143286784 n=1 Tax=Babylonia areolata TaxID=304850 RepID=UPI003FD6B401